jgi:hypothetical protein
MNLKMDVFIVTTMRMSASLCTLMTDILPRRGIHYWLSLVHTEENALLADKVAESNMGHRAAVLRWIHAHITRPHVTDDVQQLECVIRESFENIQGRRRHTDDEEDEDKFFLKVVHAHEVGIATRIRKVMRDKESLDILGVTVEDIPAICDKQLAPLSRSLCNFTKTAKSLPFDK